MANYLQILLKNYSDKKWSALQNCTYEEIDWVDSDPKPSKKHLDSLEEDWDLKLIKQQRANEIKADRDIFIYLPVEYLGTKFINSEVSGNNLQAAYNFIDEPIEWLDIEGNPVTLNKLQVKELIGLILQQRSKGYFLEAQFKKQIEAASTLEELKNISW